MKPISLTLHGAIDYLAVLIFVVAPAVIGLSGWPAVLSYALAGIHLLMTLLTISRLEPSNWLRSLCTIGSSGLSVRY